MQCVQVPQAHRTWHSFAEVLVGARHHLCGSGSLLQQRHRCNDTKETLPATVRPGTCHTFFLHLRATWAAAETGKAWIPPLNEADDPVRCSKAQQITRPWTIACNGVANGVDAV